MVLCCLPACSPDPHTHLLSFLPSFGDRFLLYSPDCLQTFINPPVSSSQVLELHTLQQASLLFETWMDVSGLFSSSLVLCPGDICARQACVVQRHACLVKETDLKPLPDCLPSVCHTLQHLGHLFCGPPSGCEMEHLCGLT